MFPGTSGGRDESRYGRKWRPQGDLNPCYRRERLSPCPSTLVNDSGIKLDACGNGNPPFPIFPASQPVSSSQSAGLSQLPPATSRIRIFGPPSPIDLSPKPIKFINADTRKTWCQICRHFNREMVLQVCDPLKLLAMDVREEENIRFHARHYPCLPWGRRELKGHHPFPGSVCWGRQEVVIICIVFKCV